MLFSCWQLATAWTGPGSGNNLSKTLWLWPLRPGRNSARGNLDAITLVLGVRELGSKYIKCHAKWPRGLNRVFLLAYDYKTILSKVALVEKSRLWKLFLELSLMSILKVTGTVQQPDKHTTPRHWEHTRALHLYHKPEKYDQKGLFCIPHRGCLSAAQLNQLLLPKLDSSSMSSKSLVFFTFENNRLTESFLITANLMEVCK